jgi:UDP-glucose 4-epimerase
MAHYLITGGCGFIGSHLAELLLAQGHKVRVLDNLSTGKRENLPEKAELIAGDIADRYAVELALAGVDGCFHLAAVASVQRCNRDWLGVHRTNLTGTINILDCARATAEREAIPIVYASSAAVYGDAPETDIPLSEKVTPVPLSVYGADKLGCELHARVASRVYGVPTVGLRFFNVYGPRQDPSSPYSGVISIFCARLSHGLPISIFGDGQQVRDFVYVADVVRALSTAMQSCTALPAGSVLNICTGRPISILTLADTIADLCQTHPTIHHAPAREGDIRISIGNPRYAAEQLGFVAYTSLSEGLEKTLRDYLPTSLMAAVTHISAHLST